MNTEATIEVLRKMIPDINKENNHKEIAAILCAIQALEKQIPKNQKLLIRYMFLSLNHGTRVANVPFAEAMLTKSLHAA